MAEAGGAGRNRRLARSTGQQLTPAKRRYRALLTGTLFAQQARSLHAAPLARHL